MKTLSVRIEDNLMLRFKAYCKQNGFGIRNVVEVLIERELKDKKRFGVEKE